MTASKPSCSMAQTGRWAGVQLCVGVHVCVSGLRVCVTEAGCLNVWASVSPGLSAACVFACELVGVSLGALVCLCLVLFKDCFFRVSL